MRKEILIVFYLLLVIVEGSFSQRIAKNHYGFIGMFSTHMVKTKVNENFLLKGVTYLNYKVGVWASRDILLTRNDDKVLINLYYSKETFRGNTYIPYETIHHLGYINLDLLYERRFYRNLNLYTGLLLKNNVSYRSSVPVFLGLNSNNKSIIDWENVSMPPDNSVLSPFNYGCKIGLAYIISNSIDFGCFYENIFNPVILNKDNVRLKSQSLMVGIKYHLAR